MGQMEPTYVFLLMDLNPALLNPFDLINLRCYLSTKSKKSELLFRMPEKDSEARISRETLARMAAVRGTSETEVLHLAARRLADEILPLYEKDDGPLTDQQMNRIAALAAMPELGGPAISFGASFRRTTNLHRDPSHDLALS